MHRRCNLSTKVEVIPVNAHTMIGMPVTFAKCQPTQCDAISSRDVCRGIRNVKGMISRNVLVYVCHRCSRLIFD